MIYLLTLLSILTLAVQTYMMIVLQNLLRKLKQRDEKRNDFYLHEFRKTLSKEWEK